MPTIKRKKYILRMFAHMSCGDVQYISKFLSIHISFQVLIKVFIFIISI